MEENLGYSEKGMRILAFAKKTLEVFIKFYKKIERGVIKWQK